MHRRAKTDRLIRYFILLAVAAALLIGCKGGIDKTLEQTLEETHDLAPTGSLSIKTTDGSIRIYGSNSAGLRLEAIKRAYSIARLNGIRVQISTRDDSVSVETIFPPKPEWWRLGDRSGTVDYTLVVPQEIKMANLEVVNGEVAIEGLRGGSATASLRNGRMSARNCFARLDYRVVNGAIDLYYNWWEKKIFLVKATTSNGPTAAFLPGNASFRLEAEARNGHIVTNFLDPHQQKQGGSKLRTIIGSDPGPTFQIETRNGNIGIERY